MRVIKHPVPPDGVAPGGTGVLADG